MKELSQTMAWVIIICAIVTACTVQHVADAWSPQCPKAVAKP